MNQAPSGPGPHVPRLAARFTRLALGAAALALLLAGTVLNFSMVQLAQRALVADHTALADVIAKNAVAALMFRDEAAASETLATLQASPHVLLATLSDRTGQPFTRFERGEPVPGGLASWWAPLVIERGVSQDGPMVGRIELQVSRGGVLRQALWFGVLTLGAAAGALALTYGLAVGVRREVGAVEHRMHDLAYRDIVTGLPNRHAASARLAEAVAAARQGGPGFALLLLDLDDFKVINDNLGHQAGDAVLRALALRLRAVLPPEAPVFRFGGDEFIVVLSPHPDSTPAVELGARLLEALSRPMRAAAQEIYLRCSVGLARFPDDADDEHALLRAADAAMYHAKSLGKHRFEAYRPALLAATQHRLQTEAELRQALVRGELCLHYQPIVELGSGRLLGAEALVRWQHPQRGLVGPQHFIDVAEQSGLIVDLGGWVLAEAARQLQQWHAAGLEGFFVAVNVSARQLREGRVLAQLDEALAMAPAAARRLEIEITEHTLVEDAQDNIQTLQALRQRGVRVAIDDFGTGLSSLAYLRRLPVDKFKIDRGFVRELPDNAGDVAIVRAVVSMAQALGMALVAEGVETEAQRAALLGMGCGHAQGYLFSRPVTAQAFVACVAQLFEAAPAGAQK